MRRRVEPDRSVSIRGQIYEVVGRIPAGRVATYGQVAALVGIRGHARQVGYALHALPAGSPVPWHRVINARGGISLRDRNGAGRKQRERLEAEGVSFDGLGRVDLDEFRWRASPEPWRG